MDAQPLDSSSPQSSPIQDSIDTTALIAALKLVAEAQAKNPELVSSLTDRPRPKGYSNTTTVVYYSAKHAEELRPFLDSMYSKDEYSSEFFILHKEIFFNRIGLENTIASFKVRIYHSWKYLIDHSDPTGIYKKIREATEVRKEKGGVAIRWKVNIKKDRAKAALSGEKHSVDSSPLNATIVRPIDINDTPWRVELQKFIEEATEDKNFFRKSNLALDAEDHKWINDLLIEAGGEFHLLELTPNKITVAYSEELSRRYGDDAV